MNYKPILICAGEPNSVFLEIFFKTFKKEKFKRPIILVVSKKLLIKQMKFLKFDIKIKIIDIKNIHFKKLTLKKINIINIDLDFDKPFDLFISSTDIRYCYYRDSHKILGNTFGMLVL